VPETSIPIKEGNLTKQGRRLKTWRERYFILKDNTISYYTDKNDKKLKGSIELQRNHQILKMTATETDKPFAFKITCPERTMYVYAGSEEDMNDWIRVLRKAIPPEKGAVKLSDANLKTGDLVFFFF